ncbi:hypothetical protein [Actinomadura madurae]|uniref:hypothetical protein n=1 Tax=Actinomadura madurae TaxID=1993 RepID=UPI0020D205B6|nr:hypothetical protein [Actinomadura madurae]MCQ0016559.1 hypothetical protein [Actinomadura madurae]
MRFAPPRPSGRSAPAEFAERFEGVLERVIGDREAVAVALAGDLESAALVDRAARVCRRTGRTLLAVTVDDADDLGRRSRHLSERLLEHLGLRCRHLAVAAVPGRWPEPEWSEHGPRFELVPRFRSGTAIVAAEAGRRDPAARHGRRTAAAGHALPRRPVPAVAVPARPDRVLEGRPRGAPVPGGGAAGGHAAPHRPGPGGPPVLGVDGTRRRGRRGRASGTAHRADGRRGAHLVGRPPGGGGAHRRTGRRDLARRLRAAPAVPVRRVTARHRPAGGVPVPRPVVRRVRPPPAARGAVLGGPPGPGPAGAPAAGRPAAGRDRAGDPLLRRHMYRSFDRYWRACPLDGERCVDLGLLRPDWRRRCGGAAELAAALAAEIWVRGAEDRGAVAG